MNLKNNNMKNLNTKLENFLEIKEKHERMKSLVDDWAFDYNIEKLKPLLDDGFDGNDLIEYFTVRLIEYINTKYQQPEQVED